jgi:DNA-binding response OmpR family regulator
MNMPKMSGPSAAAVIRQTSSVPIIMFTSTNDAEEVRDAIRKGATDFILKSTGVTELIDRIEFHLSKPETENVPAISSAIKTIPAPKPSVTASKKLATTTLIVDPDATSRNIIKAVLTRLNQTVIEANDAAEAIAAFKQHDPDIVITEWKLPDMDAFKMLSELKRNRNAKELQKLLMSVRVSPEAHRKANYVGITNFLYKPLNAAKVEPMIADCVRKSMHGLRRRQKAA